LSGLYPVVAIPLAILLFHEAVGPREWAGIALAVAAGVALSWEPKKTPADAKTMPRTETADPTEQLPP
jgi:drug/metabolite transporter (DMT)-like permease